MKTIIEYLILALVQGVTEIFPISSSGHLLILKTIFNLETDNISLEIILHLASLLALIIFYRKLILSIIKGLFQYIINKDTQQYYYFKMAFFLLVSTIPSILFGYFIDGFFSYLTSSLIILSFFFILNGLNLYSLKNTSNKKNLLDLNYKSALIVGFHQVFGLLPGISRSGSAISGCYRVGLNKKESSEIAFMLLFPLVAGSLLLNLDALSFPQENLLPLLISFIFCFFITYLSLVLFIKIIKEKKIHYFSYYTILLGSLIIILS